MCSSPERRVVRARSPRPRRERPRRGAQAIARSNGMGAGRDVADLAASGTSRASPLTHENKKRYVLSAQCERGWVDEISFLRAHRHAER